MANASPALFDVERATGFSKSISRKSSQATIRLWIRGLYTGFDLDDEAGLLQLGLQDSGDALLSHLGSGDQRSVRFEMSVFHTSFHDTFLACRDRGVALHRNFLALGIYLVCLYDVLEALDLEFDVRGAFDRSVSAGQARSRA